MTPRTADGQPVTHWLRASWVLHTASVALAIVLAATVTYVLNKIGI